MGIFTRVRRLLRANINEALDRAEDPAKMLNYLILEMQEGLEQARNETATAMAAERRLAQQAEEAEHAAAQWGERARRAVVRGDDELAREALSRRLAALELAGQYQQAHREQAQSVVELRTSLDRLQQRLQEAKVRRSALLAQLDIMHAHKLVAHTMSQAVGRDAFATFDRIAGQISTERHRAISITELAQDNVEEAILVSDHTGLIERELVQIKEEIGYLEAPAEHPALEEQHNPR